MNKLRLTAGAIALGVLALSAYGCSSDAAVIEDLDDKGTTSSSSGKPKADAGRSSSGGRSTSSGSSSGRSSSSSSGGTSSGDAGSDAGTSEGCLTVTAQQWVASNASTKAFRTTFLPLFPDSTKNELRIEFFFDGNVVGSHDLGVAPNDNAFGCEQCIDADVDDTMFFQTQGTLNVTAIGDSTVTATFTDVKLVELDSEFDPVPDGRCVAITNGSIDIRP